MVIQVINFNLKGIAHKRSIVGDKEVAPGFKELGGLRSDRNTKALYICGVIYLFQ